MKVVRHGTGNGSFVVTVPYPTTDEVKSFQETVSIRPVVFRFKLSCTTRSEIQAPRNNIPRICAGGFVFSVTEVSFTYNSVGKGDLIMRV